jgi:hypothetical protein
MKDSLVLSGGVVVPRTGVEVVWTARTTCVGTPLLAVTVEVWLMFRHCPKSEFTKLHAMAHVVPQGSTHPDAEAMIVREAKIHSTQR